MFGNQQYDMPPSEQVIVYLRKSRSDDPLLTVEEVLEKHETILNEWAEKHLDGKIPEANRLREVVSGETIDDRPEMQKLLKAIESPKIKAVLTVEVQRLSRGDLEDAGRLIKLFRYTDTLIITPQKTYNLSNEYDRDFFERELKRGNEFLEYQKKIMHRGTILSVSQGNYVASLPPYGYDKAFIIDGKRKCPSLVPNEEQANAVALIYNLFCKSNYGLSEICKHLTDIGVKPPKGKYWNTAAVRSILTNPHYIGKIKWNSRKTVKSIENGEIIKSRPRAAEGEYLLFDGKHEALVSEELFYAAQSRLGKASRKKINTALCNPLASLLYCQCGKAMIYRKCYYGGKEHGSPRLLCSNQIHCGTASCSFDEVMNAVKQAIKNEIKDFEIRLTEDKSDAEEACEKQIKLLKKRLKELEAREISQWEAQTAPEPEKRMPPEIFAKLNEKLQREKSDTQKALRLAEQIIPEHKKIKNALIFFSEALKALEDNNVSAEAKNRLLKSCIDKIVYSRPKTSRNESNASVDKNSKGWSITPINLDIKFKV